MGSSKKNADRHWYPTPTDLSGANVSIEANEDLTVVQAQEPIDPCALMYPSNSDHGSCQRSRSQDELSGVNVGIESHEDLSVVDVQVPVDDVDELNLPREFGEQPIQNEDELSGVNVLIEAPEDLTVVPIQEPTVEDSPVDQ